MNPSTPALTIDTPEFRELLADRGDNLVDDDAIIAHINAALSAASLGAQQAEPTEGEWRVGEFWSSANPGTKVLMLARGIDIENFGQHKDFIRWVGSSLAAPAATAEPKVWTAEQIAEGCVAAGIGILQYSGLLKVLKAAAPTTQPVSAPAGSDHLTPENVAAVIKDLREIESGSPAVPVIDRDWRTWAGVLARIIEHLAATQPVSAPSAHQDAKDAARYRWLRDKRPVLLLTGFFGNGCVNRELHEVDAAIDTAMSTSPTSTGAAKADGGAA